MRVVSGQRVNLFLTNRTYKADKKSSHSYTYELLLPYTAVPCEVQRRCVGSGSRHPMSKRTGDILVAKIRKGKKQGVCTSFVGRDLEAVRHLQPAGMRDWSCVSQPLSDRGPVNSFFTRRGPCPYRFTGKYLSNLSSYIKLT